VAAAILVPAAACSGTSGGDLPPANAGSTLSVTSPDLTDGGTIPAEFTCDGADRGPVVMWSGASGPGSIVVLMTDTDADGFVHWLVYNLGGESGTAGGASADGVEGHNDFGTNGYRGPCPPAGDDPHHYVITVYQFAPVPSPFAPGEDAGQVIGASPVATGTLTATYARR
jgi:Raf kinase inhibitor-like YbhB/YbcL family protein